MGMLSGIRVVKAFVQESREIPASAAPAAGSATPG